MSKKSFLRHLILFALLLALVLAISLPASAFLFGSDKSTSEPAQQSGNQAPIAENLSLSTYQNVAIPGSFSAVDPEGDLITFRITKNPARGSITCAEDGSGAFTYTPYENKKGKDSFTYVAEDAQGNISQPATVSIRISKPSTEVTYSDMSGNPAHKAAIRLAEQNIMVGDQLGGTWFFRPNSPVTRTEFLAAAMDTVGLNTLTDITATGFSDDGAIAVWAKPYVASALKSGMVQGCSNAEGQAVFLPDAPITRAEATVMLNRLLQVSDVSAVETFAPANAAPVWAYQSAVNLEAVGVLQTSADGTLGLGDTLTRADAAMMLSSALDVLAFRADHSH